MLIRDFKVTVVFVRVIIDSEDEGMGVLDIFIFRLLKEFFINYSDEYVDFCKEF